MFTIVIMCLIVVTTMNILVISMVNDIGSNIMMGVIVCIMTKYFAQQCDYNIKHTIARINTNCVEGYKLSGFVLPKYEIIVDMDKKNAADKNIMNKPKKRPQCIFLAVILLLLP